MFQQNLDRYPVSIVVFNSKTSKIEELESFIPIFKSQISSFEKNKAYLLEK